MIFRLLSIPNWVIKYLPNSLNVHKCKVGGDPSAPFGLPFNQLIIIVTQVTPLSKGATSLLCDKVNEAKRSSEKWPIGDDDEAKKEKEKARVAKMAKEKVTVVGNFNVGGALATEKWLTKLAFAAI